MRCLACGSEMHLTNVVRDDTMPVAGFERHTFMCPACGDVEQRLTFTKDTRHSLGKHVPVHPAPPLSPASTLENERVAVAGVLKRVVARLRTGHNG